MLDQAYYNGVKTALDDFGLRLASRDHARDLSVGVQDDFDSPASALARALQDDSEVYTRQHGIKNKRKQRGDSESKPVRWGPETNPADVESTGGAGANDRNQGVLRP